MQPGRYFSVKDLAPAARRTLALTLGMALVGCLVGAVVIRLGAPYPHLVLKWWELAPAIALANGLGFHLEIRGEVNTFTLSEIPLLLGCLFSPPWAVIVAGLAGNAAFQILWRRQKGLKLAFNLAQLLLETVVILSLVHGLLGHADVANWANWPLVLVSVAAGSSLSTLVVFCAIYWHGGNPKLGATALALVANFTVTATLSILAALLLVEDPHGLILLSVVLVLCALAFRGFTNLSKRYASLKLLYEFTREVSGSLSGEDVMSRMLAKARDLLSAEVAEVVLLDGKARGPVFWCRSDDGVTGVADPVKAPEDGPRWADLVESGGARYVPRTERSSAGAEVRDSLGLRDLIAAPLRGDDGITGAILVGNRRGNLRTFDDEDCRLFETLANHASVAFENSRLVQQLRREAEERRYESLHDPLTGLPNRTYFCQLVDKLTAEGTPGAVLLMDLDRFKEVNDTLGHHNGDNLLRKVGSRLASAMPPGATAARLGGDEFAVLLPDADLYTAEEMAKDVLVALNHPFILDELVLDVGASIGISLAPAHGTDSALLLQRADVAMYQAKASRTGSSTYEPETDVHSPRRLALTGSLRQALEDGDILVYFQPKASLAEGHVVGVEALVRWRHPELGLLAPDEFIPIAEQSGLIAPLTSYVLRASLRQCALWRRQGYELSVAVNLAVRSLLDVNLAAEVKLLLAETGTKPEWLTLEITESGVMADPGRAICVLDKLASLGVRLSLDDFGTGYSSLAYLQKLPVNEVKVDKSFVFRMAYNRDDATIVQSIIELGHNLGLTVVAEGVEDQITWDRLRSMSCDIAQGYHLSKPVPASVVTSWLADRQLVRAPAAAGSRRL